MLVRFGQLHRLLCHDSKIQPIGTFLALNCPCSTPQHLCVCTIHVILDIFPVIVRVHVYQGCCIFTNSQWMMFTNWSLKTFAKEDFHCFSWSVPWFFSLTQKRAFLGFPSNSWRSIRNWRDIISSVIFYLQFTPFSISHFFTIITVSVSHVYLYNMMETKKGNFEFSKVYMNPIHSIHWGQLLRQQPLNPNKQWFCTLQLANGINHDNSDSEQIPTHSILAWHCLLF